MAEYKLSYFNVRVLAEPIRWILLATGTPFEDNRVEFEQWPALKQSMVVDSVHLFINMDDWAD